MNAKSKEHAVKIFKEALKAVDPKRCVLENIALTGDGGSIDALTEATITSKAVTESIERGLKKMMEIIKDSGQ